MAQAAGRRRFAGETIAKLGSVEIPSEKLDGDVTTDARVSGAIECAHPALTDQVDDFVAPEELWNLHRSAGFTGLRARSGSWNWARPGPPTSLFRAAETCNGRSQPA